MVLFCLTKKKYFDLFCRIPQKRLGKIKILVVINIGRVNKIKNIPNKEKTVIAHSSLYIINKSKFNSSFFVKARKEIKNKEKNEVKKLKKIHSHKTPTTHNFFFVLSYDLPIYNREVKNSLPP